MFIAGERSAFSDFLVGIFAGGFNGVLLSPISVTKYYGWGSDARSTFYSAARDIYHKGGPEVFFKGVNVSILRDATFGVWYEIVRSGLRHRLEKHNDTWIPTRFASDAVGAVFASIASAPYNYVRNVIYATPPNLTPPSIPECLGDLWREARQQPSTWRHISGRLYLGWGTARVALGMGLGQFIFDHAKRILADLNQ